jgi:hypothetical protein
MAPKPRRGDTIPDVYLRIIICHNDTPLGLECKKIRFSTNISSLRDSNSKVSEPWWRGLIRLPWLKKNNQSGKSRKSGKSRFKTRPQYQPR